MRIPKLNAYQLILEILSFGIVIATLVYIITKYPSMPAEIPGHYDISGAVTDYADKGIVWFLFGMDAFVYLMLTAFLFFPRLLSDPRTTAKLDWLRRVRLANQTISLLGECKLISALLLGYICLPLTGQKPLETLPIWLLTGLLVLLTTIRTVRMQKIKR